MDEVKAQLVQEIHGISAEAVAEARARQRRAEKEVQDLEELLATPGRTKTVRLIRDSEGRMNGAAVHEH
jgi:hypothetical protein